MEFERCTVKEPDGNQWAKCFNSNDLAFPAVWPGTCRTDLPVAWGHGASSARARGGILRTGYGRSDGWMAVGLGLGLAVGAGFRPTAAVAQGAAAAVTATARVLPAAGAFPSEVRALRPARGARHLPGQREADGTAGPALPPRPATTVTRMVVGNRRVIELAATGV